jgi:hypothetical protein
VPVTFVAFDLLCIDGTDLTARTYSERRELLVGLGLDGPGWATSETFDDGEALRERVRARARGRRREETLRSLSAWAARMGEDEEPELLAA